MDWILKNLVHAHPYFLHFLFPFRISIPKCNLEGVWFGGGTVVGNQNHGEVVKKIEAT